VNFASKLSGSFYFECCTALRASWCCSSCTLLLINNHAYVFSFIFLKRHSSLPYFLSTLSPTMNFDLSSLDHIDTSKETEPAKHKFNPKPRARPVPHSCTFAFCFTLALRH
jgi:hypothetical protein